MAASQINRTLEMLRHLFSWAVRHDYREHETPFRRKGEPDPNHHLSSYARFRVCLLLDRRCCVCSRCRSSAICIERCNSVGVTAR